MTPDAVKINVSLPKSLWGIRNLVHPSPGLDPNRSKRDLGSPVAGVMNV